MGIGFDGCGRSEDDDAALRPGAQVRLHHLDAELDDAEHRHGGLFAERRVGIKRRQGVAGNQDPIGPKAKHGGKRPVEDADPLGHAGQKIVAAVLLRPGVEIGQGHEPVASACLQAADDIGADGEAAHARVGDDKRESFFRGCAHLTAPRAGLFRVSHSAARSRAHCGEESMVPSMIRVMASIQCSRCCMVAMRLRSMAAPLAGSWSIFARIIAISSRKPLSP